MSKRGRRGFTLIELLVVIAIISIMMGMLLSAVNAARMAAYRLMSQNNLRQINFAAQHSNDVYRRMPPMFGYYPRWGPGAGIGSVFYHLLPLMDQKPLYVSSLNPATGFHESNHAAANGHPIKNYFNPADSTVDESELIDGRSPSGYAANMQVFGSTGH